MAYIPTITKLSVVKVKGLDDFNVSINVSVEDDVSQEVVFEKTYSKRYNSNTLIGDMQNYFQGKIQADWNLYLSEKAIFDASAFDTMISNIQSNANTYMNP